MSEMFGLGAVRLASLAARAFGWRPGEFWTATPAELAAALNLSADGGGSLRREDLNRLMEQDNGRPD